MLTAAVISIVLMVAFAAVFMAYRASGDATAREQARFLAVNRRVRALNDAITKLRGDAKHDFARTGAGITKTAHKTMDVLGAAVHREYLKLEASAGKNRRAIAVMQALLDANDAALRDLLIKLNVEDGQAVTRFMREMEARHVEIVNYLSGGGLERVADALQDTDIGSPTETFVQSDVQTTLKGMGVNLTDADLAALDAGVREDVGRGLKKRESLFVRLASMAPVVTRARELSVQSDQLKEQQRVADASAQFKQVLDAEAAHRDALLATMDSRISAISDDVRKQIERLAVTQEQSDAIKKMIADSLANVASAKTALENIAK